MSEQYMTWRKVLLPDGPVGEFVGEGVEGVGPTVGCAVVLVVVVGATE